LPLRGPSSPRLVFLGCALLAVAATPSAWAANITSAASGNWGTGTSWVGGVAPVAGDNVTIASSHTITVAAAAGAATITLAANAAGTNGIIINSGIALTVSGAITMTSPTAGTSTISVGAGTLSAASIAIPGSATAGRDCAVTVSTGTITTTGAITFSGTAAQAKFTSTGASTVNVGGNFASGGTLTTSATGTINFNGGAAQTVGTYTTYNKIAVNNTAGGVTLTGTTIFGGTLTVTTGTFAVGAFALTVTGATSVSGTLSITSTTGTKTFTGNVTINSGGTWDNTSVNAAVALAGSLQNDGTFNAGTGVYTFSGAAKTISGANAVSIPNLTVTGTVTNSGTLTVGTALSGAGGLTNTATLNIGNTSGITTLTATANPNTVNYSGAAQTVKAVTYHHLILSGSGIKTLTSVSTINGDLTLSGTCTATTAVATTIGGILTVGSGTAFTVAGFTLAVTGATSVSGTLSFSSTTATKTFTGNVTINNGGTWSNTSVNEAVTLAGSLQDDGTFNAGTGVYTFSGASKTIGGANSVSIPNLTVTGTVTNNGTLTVGTALSGAGGLTNTATLSISGTSGITTLTATANPNTVNYDGIAQTIKAVTYHHLILSGSGTKTLTGVSTINGNFTLSGTAAATAAVAMTVGGDFSIGSTASFTAGAFIHDIKGNLSNSGTFTTTSSTIRLSGTADQAIGGTATTTFNNVTVNKASGVVTVGTTFNVSGTLTLTSGNISTGGNTVAITSTGAVSRTSGHVVGNLQKNVATGSNVARTFEIGDASNYAKLDVVFASVSVTGNFTASTTSGDHANITSSDVNPAKSVNRYWTVSKDVNLAFTNYSATFNFVSGDVDAGSSTSNFVVRRYSGGSWSSTTVGTRTATSTQITGQAGTGDFQVGNLLSVAVSNNVFAFGTQPPNTWLTAQSSVITNDGTEPETIVAKISTLTAGANTWTLSASSNGADQVRAQWSITSASGPWTDISAYDTNFTISSSLAAAGTLTLYLRVQTPTSTSSLSQYSSTVTVTAQ